MKGKLGHLSRGVDPTEVETPVPCELNRGEMGYNGVSCRNGGD